MQTNKQTHAFTASSNMTLHGVQVFHQTKGFFVHPSAAAAAQGCRLTPVDSGVAATHMPLQLLAVSLPAAVSDTDTDPSMPASPSQTTVPVAQLVLGGCWRR